MFYAPLKYKTGRVLVTKYTKFAVTYLLFVGIMMEFHKRHFSRTQVVLDKMSVKILTQIEGCPNILQHFLRFNQNQQEMSANVVNFQCPPDTAA